jgi:hypothetical protein
VRLEGLGLESGPPLRDESSSASMALVPERGFEAACLVAVALVVEAGTAEDVAGIRHMLQVSTAIRRFGIEWCRRWQNWCWNRSLLTKNQLPMATDLAQRHRGTSCSAVATRVLDLYAAN